MSDGDADEILGFDRRKVLIGVGVAAALGVGAAVGVGAIASFGELVDAIGRADVTLLPLCLLGELAAYAGYMVAYRSVAAAVGGPLLRYRDAARVVTLGLGAYLVGAAAGSLGVDFWAMRKAGAGTHEAARRTLALNTLQSGALMTLAALSGVALLVRGAPGTATIFAAVWVSAVPSAIAGAAYLTSGSRRRRLTEAPESPPRPSGKAVRQWCAWLGAKLRRGFADVMGGVLLVRRVVLRPGRYVGGLLGYPLFWLGDFFILWMALDAFGVRLSPERLIVAEATAWILSLLPLPGGGSGAAEATMTFTLHAVGVPLSPALFAALVYRGVNFWLPLLPALLLLPQVKPLQEDLEQAPREEKDPRALRP